MRERKILYLLVLTAVLGIGVTFCTSRLLGVGAGSGEAAHEQTAEAEGAETPEETVQILAGGGSSPLPRTADSPAADSSVPVPEETRPETEIESGPDAQADFGAEKEEEPAGEAAAEAADALEAGVEITPLETAAESASLKKTAEITPLETTVAITPLETAAETASGGQKEPQLVAAEDRTGENPYRTRLQELDMRIQKIRESREASAPKNGGGAASAGNQASDELWLWNNELQTIYNELLDRLGGDQAEALVASQREWYKSRDAEAVAAAQSSSGGSQESVEYTSSLAVSARARAYELVTLYENVLTD